MSDECIFCHRDPYHYVDIGVGFQAAAVNCCELGIALYQHGDEDLAKVANRIEELEAERKEADVAALERILKEHGRVFDAMVDAAEDAAGKGVSFNVVVGRAIRAALAEIKGEQP